MKFANKKRIVVLSLALLLCIVGGVAVFLLSGRQGEDVPAPADPQQGGDAAMEHISTLDPAQQRYLFRLVQKREEALVDYDVHFQKYFILDGQVVRLVPGREDSVYSDVCDIGGTVLKSIGTEDVFALQTSENESYHNMALDNNGTFWCLLADDKNQYVLRALGADGAEYSLGERPFLYAGKDMGIWGKYAVLLGQVEGMQQGYRMCIYDLEAGNRETIDSVNAFCLDESGNIYYTQDDPKGSMLICRELSTGTTVWKNMAPAGAGYNQVFFHPELGGVYLLQTLRKDQLPQRRRWEDPL